MINSGDISPHEVIKVLVEFDGIEEELYAKVLRNDSISIMVTYLVPTSKVYKGACVYSFESSAERVNFDSISEHHVGVIDITDIDMTQVGRNMFVFNSETVIDDDSDIDDESSEDGSYESDFVVSDEECATPRTLGIADHLEVDRGWNGWQPSTSGGSHFKGVIDAIECRIRHHSDEKKFA